MEPGSQKVSVIDVNMPFGSMVVFIFKWTIASIPSMIIVFCVGAAVYALLDCLVAGLVRP